MSDLGYRTRPVLGGGESAVTCVFLFLCSLAQWNLTLIQLLANLEGTDTPLQCKPDRTWFKNLDPFC